MADPAVRYTIGTDAAAAGTTSVAARLRQIIDTYLADGTIGLAAIEALVDDLESGGGTGMGHFKILEVSVTSAANAGADTTLATITDQPCEIEFVIVHADAAQTADMTNAAVKGGAAKALTFIAAADLLQADVDAENKQVAWDGRVRLPATSTIVMEHTGTGATPLDLTVTIGYRACVAGGYLA